MDEIATRIAAAARSAEVATLPDVDAVNRRANLRTRKRTATAVASGVAAMIATTTAVLLYDSGGEYGDVAAPSTSQTGSPLAERTINAEMAPPGPAGPEVQEVVGRLADQLYAEFPDDFFASALDPSGPRFYFKGAAPIGALDLLGSQDFRSHVIEEFGVSLKQVEAHGSRFSSEAGLRGRCQVQLPAPTRRTWLVHCKTDADIESARPMAAQYLGVFPVEFDKAFSVVNLG